MLFEWVAVQLINKLSVCHCIAVLAAWVALKQRGRQADRLGGRQAGNREAENREAANREAGRQRGREAERLGGRQAGRQTGRQQTAWEAERLGTVSQRGRIKIHSYSRSDHQPRLIEHAATQEFSLVLRRPLLET